MAENAAAAREEVIGKGLINEDLFKEIDKLELGPRLTAWLEARRTAPRKVCVERQKLALESWKETEGEDIEIRRAKLFAKILGGVPISILDFDLIVGRVSNGLLSASTSIDLMGDYIPGLWDDHEDLDLTMTAKTAFSRKDREVLRESAKFFDPISGAAHLAKTLRSLAGTWPEDCDGARVRDPKNSPLITPAGPAIGEWDRVLAKGMRGLINDAQARINCFMEARETDVDKLHFWKAAVIVCEALIAYAHRYAELARKMAKETKNAVRQQELLEIAGVCEWVPENQPRNFHEAVQLMHFVALGKNLEHPASYYPVVGRLDQHLWPYFEKDFRSGRLNLERAAELIECVIGEWGSQIFVASAAGKQVHQVSFGLNLINVGGVDKDGNDVSNLLSYLILHATGLLKISSPTINVQWNSNTPRWLMDKSIDTNIKTKGGIPLFENSDHVAKNFAALGIPIEEARNWYGMGCVTPSLPNKIDFFGVGGAGTFNLAAVLEITLNNGLHVLSGKKIGLDTGDPRTFKTFEELYSAFQRQYEYIVNRVLWLSSVVRTELQKYTRLPFLSTVIAGCCMETGKDVAVPDPSSAFFGVTDRAIVDTADSLFAIKKLVFDEKKLSMDELLGALDSDFEGSRGKEIRQMCLAAPKFGNDIDEVDLMVHEIGAFSAKVILGYDNSPYLPFRIAREGVSWHYYGGLTTGALPNGRKAYQPLNDGSISPMGGMDKCGPTAVLRSVLKAGNAESSATALNQKFSLTAMQSPESQKKLATLTDTFLRSGGQHIQFNLVDAEELRDAKAHPEKHQDLIVRIGGFSAYFVQLSPEIQNDVINRTEQGGL